MKYLLDLDSPDFSVLLDAAKHEITQAALRRIVEIRRWGAGHAITVAAGRRLQSAEKCLAALIVAQQNTEPERATPPPNTNPYDLLQTYFEEDLPRPVQPRPKASNIRRRSSKGAV